MKHELVQGLEDRSELDMSNKMDALHKHFRSLSVIGKGC